MSLVLHSEPYAATGNIGDGGFSRLLGAPSIETLQLVVREALQNSCDAAKLGHGPEVLVRLRTLQVDEMEVLREQVLVALPFIPGSRAALEAFLDNPEPRVLEIADFRTTGLSGPTRADRMPVGTRRTDFIDFFRNVGTRRHTRQGGGTYGFGKATLYKASRCGTILVHTLTSGADGEHRVMACHLGESGERATGDGYLDKFTGRHWWGVADADGLVEPVTGGQAMELATSLRFPDRGAGDTGTTIMIFDPDLGDVRNLDDGADDGDEDADIPVPDAALLQETAGHLAGGILWNFWPRMMASTPNSRRLRVRVLAEDVEIEVPAPQDVPPLDHYCAAMDMIRSGAREVIPVRKYRRLLGHLATVRGLRSPRTPPFDGPATPFAPVSAGIALMRPVELVVRIVQGAPLPNEDLEWAGVFVASAENDIEQAFANSEPAAHDNWDPRTLSDPQDRRLVNAALKRIARVAGEVAAPSAGLGPSSDATVPLAAVAGRLGQFLRGTGHGGPTTGGGGGGTGSGGGGARRRVSAPSFSRLHFIDGEAVAEFLLTLSGRGPQDEMILTPAFAVEGATVSLEESAGAVPPRILEVLDAGGNSLEGTERVHVGDLEGEVSVLVTVPADCAVTVAASLATAE
jgi:hypothetical protein